MGGGVFSAAYGVEAGAAGAHCYCYYYEIRISLLLYFASCACGFFGFERISIVRIPVPFSFCPADRNFSHTSQCKNAITMKFTSADPIKRNIIYYASYHVLLFFPPH